MGGRSSREYEEQKRRRDEISSSNQREMENLRSCHREQSDRMQQELASRNADLERLRRNAIENQRRNDEELRATRQRQAERAAQLEKERIAELAGLRDDAEREKRRVNEQFEKRAAELKKEHDEVIRKTQEEKAEEKRKAEAAIRKAESERDEVERQKSEDVRKHREALDKMSKDHRKEVKKHYDELNEEMEKHTLAAIERIALETEHRMAIVDAAQAKMQKDAIESKFSNLAKEYLALISRARQVEEAMGVMIEVMAPNMIKSGDEECNNSNMIKTNDVPYELRDLHAEYQKEEALFERQMNKMKQRLKTNFDLPESFTGKLMEPWVHFEESQSNVRIASLPITMAIHKNDGSELGKVRERFVDHMHVLRGTIQDMDAIVFKNEAAMALENMAQRSIEQ